MVDRTTRPRSTPPWRPPGSTDLADRSVDELSGGQRQRVWIAMALAQGTRSAARRADDVPRPRPPGRGARPARRPQRRDGRTIVCVLHDLNLACRYADHLVAMGTGTIVAEGPPAEVVDAALVARSSACDSRVLPDPMTGTPMVVPVPTRRRGAGDVQPSPQARRQLVTHGMNQTGCRDALDGYATNDDESERQQAATSALSPTVDQLALEGVDARAHVGSWHPSSSSGCQSLRFPQRVAPRMLGPQARRPPESRRPRRALRSR